MSDKQEKSNETSTGGISNDSIDAALRICQVIEVAILLFNIWILLCSITYGFKTKKWRKRPGSNSLDQGIMYTCCVAAIALMLPRFTFSVVVILMHPDALSPICESMTDASNGLYFVAGFPVYFYLWLRQRAIYCHPAQTVIGKWAIVVGWFVLVSITSLSIVLAWAYITPDTYTGTKQGCIFKNQSDGHAKLLLALAGILILAQVSLLALFIYPMVRCELEQKKKRSRSASSISQTLDQDLEATCRVQIQNACRVCRKVLCGARDTEQGSSLARTIRRSVYGALVVMASDLMATLSASFGIPTTIPRTVPTTLYDVSFLINSLCILSTFGNNKKILTVFWSCSADTAHEEEIRESTQITPIQNGDETGQNYNARADRM